jgi:hypothetical protein
VWSALVKEERSPEFSVMAQPLQGDISPISNAAASQVVMSTVNLATKSTEPVARNLAQCNIEMAGLMTRRARALMDASSRMTQCKTPAELADMNMKYWQSATQDYIDASRRMVTVFTASTAQASNPEVSPAVANPFLDNPVLKAWTSMWNNGQASRDVIAPRDLVTFPDPTLQPVANGRRAS